MRSEKRFQESTRTDIVILDQNFRIIEIDRVIKVIAMFIYQGKLVFISNSSIMLIHSFMKLFACLSNIDMITVQTAQLIDNAGFLIKGQWIFEIIESIKQGIGGFITQNYIMFP